MPEYPLHVHGPSSADFVYISSVLLLFGLHSVAFETLLPRCGGQLRISQHLRANLAEVWTWGSEGSPPGRLRRTRPSLRGACGGTLALGSQHTSERPYFHLHNDYVCVFVGPGSLQPCTRHSYQCRQPCMIARAPRTFAQPREVSQFFCR